jgi:hypothetical protein
MLLVASVSLWSAPVWAETLQVELVIKGGQLVSGPKVIRLKRDDQVKLVVVTDRADELHLHGYNLEQKVAPGRPATLEFAAKRTGRFALELHKSGTEVSVLEIYPK